VQSAPPYEPPLHAFDGQDRHPLRQQPPGSAEAVPYQVRDHHAPRKQPTALASTLGIGHRPSLQHLVPAVQQPHRIGTATQVLPAISWQLLLQNASGKAVATRAPPNWPTLVLFLPGVAPPATY
jgi:hypothetical protein